MKASDLLVRCLEVEGVEHVFGLPGEELEDLLFSLRDSTIEFVPVRHEQGAAFMADVHGRLTGDAGVCLSTLGPGATNLLTGVADAHLDKSPLVAITGQADRERLHKESHQALDVVGTFEPVVKWNSQVAEADTVPESVRKAFKLAEYEKPGATHLEFPEDVAAADVGAGATDDADADTGATDDVDVGAEATAGADVVAEPLAVRPRVRRADPDEGSLEEAVSLLEDAEAPLVLAGNGAVRTPAADELRALVEHAGMPVVATFMGKGAVSDRLDNSLFTLESGPNGEAAAAIERADCVLAVGYDIAEHDPRSWNPDLDTHIVHVDHEPAEVYRHYNPDLELVADIAAVLGDLRNRIASASGPAWCRDLRDRIVEDVYRKPDADEPFSVRRSLPYLREAMADEDVLVSDVGSHKMAIARSFPTYEPHTCIISNGLASMGIAVPGGIAADLAVDANVVVATGDGGFLMNAAEIETATRLDLGYTIVVFVDDDYGLVSEQQIEHTGEAFGTRLTNPDFRRFAESFGIASYRPENWTEVESTFEAVVPSDEMALIEVPIPR